MRAYDPKRSDSAFLKDLAHNLGSAQESLMARCAVSDDADVRGAYERWKALNEVSKFAEDSAKERNRDE